MKLKIRPRSKDKTLSIELNNIIWVTQLPKLAKLVRSYGQDADDIMQLSFLIFISRNKNPNPPRIYYRILFREAARKLNLNKFRLISFEKLIEESGWEPVWQDRIEVIEHYNRIKTALICFPVVWKAAQLVLQGETMQVAAAAVGISQSRFTELLHKAGVSK